MACVVEGGCELHQLWSQQVWWHGGLHTHKLCSGAAGSITTHTGARVWVICEGVL